MQPFYKSVLHTPSEYFCTNALHLNIFVPNVFNKRNLPEIQGKSILSQFESREGECFFKKKGIRLLNKTVSEI